MGLLTSAKPLATSPAAKKGASKKHTVVLRDLELYAQLDAVAKAADAMKKTVGADINREAMAEFIRLGSNGVRPESFTGIEGNASASIELRKRSTASVPTEAEAAELKAAGIPLEVVETQAELFGINPKYAQDMDLLSKVETALAGLIPDDFFFKQEQVKKEVVSDASVAAVFALIGRSKDASEHASLVSMVTTQAIKAKLTSTDMAKVLNAVKPHLTGETEAEAATKALAK